MAVTLAKTRSYYVELGAIDKAAGRGRSSKFSPASWQGSAYDMGFTYGYYTVPGSQEVKPAQVAPQVTKPAQGKPPYLANLKRQLQALRDKHGFTYHGHDVCQWSTKRRLRPQVVRQLAKLEGLIQVATRGWQYSRFQLVMQVAHSQRFHKYSLAKLYKQGKYGHNLLGAK